MHKLQVYFIYCRPVLPLWQYYSPTKTWDPRNSNTVGVIDLFHRKSASSMTPNEARTIKHNMLHKLIVLCMHGKN